MFQFAPEPTALVRVRDEKVLEVNRRYAQTLGYEPEELIGRSTMPGDLGLWLEAGDRDRWVDLLARQGGFEGYEAPMRRKDGSTATVLMSGALVEVERERCVITAVHDISSRKAREEELNRIAYRDALTGLPNRLLLGDRLRHAIAQNRRDGKRIAVCYLDLDGFKQFNDTLGHHAGDQVLVQVADRLQAAVREADTVARLGGDEFVLLLCGLASDDECLVALERLLPALSAPYRVLNRQQDGISASIGVTIFPTDGSDPDALMRQADRAMYAAKQAGKGRYRFFDRRLDPRTHLEEVGRMPAAVTQAPCETRARPDTTG